MRIACAVCLIRFRLEFSGFILIIMKNTTPSDQENPKGKNPKPVKPKPSTPKKTQAGRRKGSGAAPDEKRTAVQNKKTINRLLNLYDEVLVKYSGLIKDVLESEESLGDKATLLNNFKALSSMADPLMKRWYLVHRGYDINSRQAQEDAKAKTLARDKQAHANAPPEDRILVVGSYDTVMEELWNNLPDSEKQQRTV